MKLLNEILGTKYPIIQGGMANIATGEFAAACSNAGALGIIGAGGMNADTLRQNIRRCREQRRISSLSVFIWQGLFDQKTARGNISHYLRYLSALHPGFLQARGCCPRPKCR